MQFLPARELAIFLLSLAVVACAPQERTSAPDPAAALQSVPPPDPSKYKGMIDMRNWRNPYLIVRTDGVALLDPANSTELLLKPDEVTAALARLPASAWPYGRVVAITENGVRASEQDGVAIRRNKGIVGGILQSAHVGINWVPSA